MLLLSLFFSRVDIFGSVGITSVSSGVFGKSFFRRNAVTDVFHHFAEANKFITDGFVVFIKSDGADVAFGKVEIANAFCAGGLDGTNGAAESFAEVFKTCADGKTIFGESGLASSVNKLEENFSHSYVDSVADKVGVKSFEDGFSGKDLACHCGGMGHTGAADGFNKSFFDNSVFYVKGEFASALLGCASADSVGKTGDIFDLISFYPSSFFRNGSRSVVGSFGNGTHPFDIF